MVSMRIPMSEVEGHEQEKAEVDEMVMALDPVPQVVVVRCDVVKENAMWHDGKGRGNESVIESEIGVRSRVGSGTSHGTAFTSRTSQPSITADMAIPIVLFVRVVTGS